MRVSWCASLFSLLGAGNLKMLALAVVISIAGGRPADDGGRPCGFGAKMWLFGIIFE